MTIERNPFSSDSIINISIGVFSLLAVTFLALGFAGNDDPMIIIQFSIVVVIWVPASLLFLRDGVRGSRHAVFEISGIGANLVDEKGEARIEWSPEITADVRTDRWSWNRTHGPLVGLKFIAGGGKEVSLDVNKGWPITDVRNAWDPFIDAVSKNGLKMGGGLAEYLKYRSDKGLDE